VSRDGVAAIWTAVAALAACAPMFALTVALYSPHPEGTRPLPARSGPAAVMVWQPGFWGEVHPAAARDGVRSPLPAARRG
jgi:hypothetical protein